MNGHMLKLLIPDSLSYSLTIFIIIVFPQIKVNLTRHQMQVLHSLQ